MGKKRVDQSKQYILTSLDLEILNCLKTNSKKSYLCRNNICIKIKRSNLHVKKRLNKLVGYKLIKIEKTKNSNRENIKLIAKKEDLEVLFRLFGKNL